jgi:hypothetical protein
VLHVPRIAGPNRSGTRRAIDAARRDRARHRDRARSCGGAGCPLGLRRITADYVRSKARGEDTSPGFLMMSAPDGAFGSAARKVARLRARRFCRNHEHGRARGRDWRPPI